MTLVWTFNYGSTARNRSLVPRATNVSVIALASTCRDPLTLYRLTQLC